MTFHNGIESYSYSQLIFWRSSKISSHCYLPCFIFGPEKNHFQRSELLLSASQIFMDGSLEHKALCTTFNYLLWVTMMHKRKIMLTSYPGKRVHFSRSVMSNSSWPHESQHPRPPCPSPTPGVHSDSGPSSRWCHPAISSSVSSTLIRLLAQVTQSITNEGKHTYFCDRITSLYYLKWKYLTTEAF